ncbi:MAG: LicD family protein [Bacteroidales bacterium]|nr:LicD family protein [Bacteroidales bacterium]
MKVFNTGETEESLKKAYNAEGSDLRKGQIIMLDMLKYIDKLCKENGIEYRLSGGQVLGAIRHGGFIPWDDDIDISLSRKNYKRLHKILQNQTGGRYQLQDHHTDPNYYLFYYKLRDTKSHKISEVNTKSSMRYDGFQVDCFPTIKGSIDFLHKIDIVFFNKFTRRFYSSNKLMFELCFFFQKNVLHNLFRFISYVFGDKNVIGFDYGSGIPDKVNYSYIYPLKDIMYEGVVFPGPKDPVKYCTVRYGETWNELPPADKRNHHGVDGVIIDD